MEQLNPVQTALYQAIKRFVQRQSLVLEALKDLRPDLVMETADEGTPQEQAEMRKTYIRQPSTGYWGKNREWEYLLHGSGCRLVNVATKENIQWDVGDLHRFDRFWFVNYLEWLLDSDVVDKDVSRIRGWLEKQLETRTETKPSYGPLQDIIFPILEELRELGILSQDEQYYTLVEEKGDS
jgi:hypothetical protein